MQNKFSMRHKPVTEIERKCKSIRRIYEVVLTMPDPLITISRYYNNIIIYATNRNGICTYKYNGPCVDKSDIALSIEIESIS